MIEISFINSLQRNKSRCHEIKVVATKQISLKRNKSHGHKMNSFTQILFVVTKMRMEWNGFKNYVLHATINYFYNSSVHMINK